MKILTMEKWCGTCEQFKAQGKFNRNVRRKDGLQAECRECQAKRERRYLESEAGREARKRSEAAKYQKRLRDSPEKLRARYTLRYAVRTGKIQRGKCLRCESMLTQGHHEDYSKPLEVIWVCVKHHAEMHREKAE